MSYQLFTDGSFYETTQKASIGGVLYCGHEEVMTFSEVLDEQWRLVHELKAIEYGLQKAVLLGVKELTCYSDSRMVRNFNCDVLPVHTCGIRNEVIQSILSLKKHFQAIEFKHILRNKNKRADALAARVHKNDYYENLHFLEREAIPIKKRLIISNVVSVEDAEDKNVFYHELNDVGALHLKLSMLDDWAHIRASKDEILYAERTCNPQKINSFSIDVIMEAMSKIHDTRICIVIQSDSVVLQKFEMLLRQRFECPRPHTPFLDRFREQLSRFTNVYIVNHEEYRNMRHTENHYDM